MVMAVGNGGIAERASWIKKADSRNLWKGE